MYYKIQNYADAESLFRRAVHIVEQREDCEPDIVLLLDDLAGSLFCQQNYVEAEVYCRRALAIQEERTQKSKPATGSIMSSLASALAMQQRYAEA
jgi:tetratricopeptide (TPR) repeat protein